jgi:hypothetical protein
MRMLLHYLVLIMSSLLQALLIASKAVRALDANCNGV